MQKSAVVYVNHDVVFWLSYCSTMAKLELVSIEAFSHVSKSAGLKAGVTVSDIIKSVVDMGYFFEADSMYMHLEGIRGAMRETPAYRRDVIALLSQAHRLLLNQLLLCNRIAVERLIEDKRRERESMKD